jgi:hypothetical protein
MGNNNPKFKEKKVAAIGKEIYKVEDGKVYIESEELARALQDGELDIFLGEEAAGFAGDTSLDDGDKNGGFLCC